MAITFDKALGSESNTGTSFTTTLAAASASRVVLVSSWFAATVGVPTATAGGTAMTLDKQVTNGGDSLAIFSLVVAGGLASGSTIATTFNGTGLGGHLQAASSYLGTTGVDTSGSNTGTTAAAWSTGSVTNAVADSVYVAGAGTDGSMTSESSTPSSGTERFDLFASAVNQGVVMQDLIVASVASQAVTGTWGTTTGLTTQTMGLVIYKGTAGGATGIPDLIMAPAHR